jgi:hypothetical protein
MIKRSILHETPPKEGEPAVAVEGNAERRFARLVREWKAGRDPTTIAARMVLHPAYQAIIRMGDQAVPMVLNELKREPDEWFYALAKITGENPIPDAHRGRFGLMVNAWLNWGKKNGRLAR